MFFELKIMTFELKRSDIRTQFKFSGKTYDIQTKNSDIRTKKSLTFELNSSFLKSHCIIFIHLFAEREMMLNFSSFSRKQNKTK